jgi:hypothetical protein
MSDQKDYVISQNVAQAIVDYLQTRPYNEVYKLIAAVVQLQPAPAIVPSTPETRATEAVKD